MASKKVVSATRSNNRFDKEVKQLMSNGVSRSNAEAIVQKRAEAALRQGWGMGPAKDRPSEGNKLGGGGRSANYKRKK